MDEELDALNVPDYVAPLLQLAEKWGIGDDDLRVRAVHSATREELEELVSCLDAVDSGAVFDWLAGPESYNLSPSVEYIAVTNLTMAMDLARLLLSRMSRPPDMPDLTM